MTWVLRAPGRVISIVLIGTLLGPTVAWCHYVGEVFAGCAGGFGNQRISGHFTATGCLLFTAGEPVYRLPWLTDIAAAASLFLALVLALVVLVQPATSSARPMVAVLPIPVLLIAGVLMRGRSWGPVGLDRMASGFVSAPAPPQRAVQINQTNLVQAYSVEPYPFGWRVRVTGVDLFLPAPGVGWYLVVVFAGLLAIALAAVVWRAHLRRQSTLVKVRANPQWSSSLR